MASSHSSARLLASSEYWVGKQGDGEGAGLQGSSELANQLKHQEHSVMHPTLRSHRMPPHSQSGCCRDSGQPLALPRERWCLGTPALGEALGYCRGHRPQDKHPQGSASSAAKGRKRKVGARRPQGQRQPRRGAHLPCTPRTRLPQGLPPARHNGSTGCRKAAGRLRSPSRPTSEGD